MYPNILRRGAGARSVRCGLQSNALGQNWDRGVYHRYFKTETVIQQDVASGGCGQGFTW